MRLAALCGSAPAMARSGPWCLALATLAVLCLGLAGVTRAERAPVGGGPCDGPPQPPSPGQAVAATCASMRPYSLAAAAGRHGRALKAKQRLGPALERFAAELGQLGHRGGCRALVVVRGVLFRPVGNQCHECHDGAGTDYSVALPSLRERVLRPLESAGCAADVALLTYPSERLQEAICALRPVHTFVWDAEKMGYPGDQASLLVAGLRSITPEALAQYAVVLVARLDTMFKRPVTELKAELGHPVPAAPVRAPRRQSASSRGWLGWLGRGPGRLSNAAATLPSAPLRLEGGAVNVLWREEGGKGLCAARDRGTEKQLEREFASKGSGVSKVADALYVLAPLQMPAFISTLCDAVPPDPVTADHTRVTLHYMGRTLVEVYGTDVAWSERELWDSNSDHMPNPWYQIQRQFRKNSGKVVSGNAPETIGKGKWKCVRASCLPEKC